MDISSMLEVQVNEVKEVDSKENVTPKEHLPSTTNVPTPISEEEYGFYKLMFGNGNRLDVSAVRFHKLHCTACDAHIGSAPADSNNMFEHPVLRTLLCSKCRDFYGDGTFEQGDDATDMFCRWCANGGNLYCCSFCSNTFCYKCIKRNFDPVLRRKIEADERWKCFVCDPTDLYNARGTCWALLQHVQTVNRILQNSCVFTQAEIDERMNADESKCCPRRKKRKRRKNGSNSDEDDATYSPNQIVANALSKRKRRSRGKPKLSNGSNIPMTNKILGGLLENSSLDQSEILPSLLSCEQTMVECENATVSTDGRIISQNQANLTHLRVKAVNAKPTTMHTPVVNVVATSSLMPSVSSNVPIRHIPNSVNNANEMHQMKVYNTLHSVPTPMVTIPNQNVNILAQFSKPESQTHDTASSSNVIEIESDPEEVAVVTASQTPRSSRQLSDCNKAVPVALVSSKNNYNIARRQELQERRKAKTLNQRLLPHGKEVDNVLLNLKKKFQGWFEISQRDELKKFEVDDARRLIKQFHREVRETVTQLAYINDRIVREYNRWKRYQMKIGGKQSPDRTHFSMKGKSEDIPLHMTCTNESGSDSDADTEIEYSIVNPSELIGTTNAVDGIKFFKTKNTLERGVGDGSALLVDKSVQIYDKELQDCEKCMGRSVLNTVNQPIEKSNNPLKSYVKQANKQSRNYEEQFIRFLQSQSLKAQRVEEGSPKHLPDPNETSLKDLIEANSPFVSEMLRTMDKSGTPSRSNSIISIRKESDLKSSTQQPHLISCRPVENLVKKINNAFGDLNKKTVPREFSNGNGSQNETETQKGHCSTSDQISVVNVLKEEQNLNRTNTVDSESSNEDDCTIIDD